jgi:hypothetical protein
MVCECGAEGPPGWDDIEAIDRWNTRAQAKAAPQAEPVATYMGTDWAAQSQFMAECASLEPGTELFAHRPAPVAELVRQCITDELAEWTGDNRVIIEHAMRDLTARIDAKLAQLRTKGE